jgi:PAS domain S-box-containing protein
MEQEIKMPEEMIIVTETDGKGIIKFANDDFCKIAGYSLDELIEQPHSKVRHPDMPKSAFVDLWQTAQRGEIWKGIVKNKTKSGEYYWVNATVYSSKTSTGGLRYISVRVKPTNEEIASAIKLYSTLK